MKKNKIILSFLLILLTMFVFPVFIVNFVEPHNSMGWLIILFFGINPILSIVLGILAATDIHRMWYIPLLVPFLFPVLYWIILQQFVVDFYVYSLGYFVVGLVAMIISRLLSRDKK